MSIVITDFPYTPCLPTSAVETTWDAIVSCHFLLVLNIRFSLSHPCYFYARKQECKTTDLQSVYFIDSSQVSPIYYLQNT